MALDYFVVAFGHGMYADYIKSSAAFSRPFSAASFSCFGAPSCCSNSPRRRLMLRTSVMICQFWMNYDTVLFTRVKASVICIITPNVINPTNNPEPSTRNGTIQTFTR
jgi:hypothetical protein